MDKNKDLNENGFSLLELVVAIGILLVLSCSSLVGIVSDVQAQQRQQAVEIAVGFVVASALQNENGFDDRYTAETAVDAYNSSESSETVGVELDRDETGCMTFSGTYVGKDEVATDSLKCSIESR